MMPSELFACLLVIGNDHCSCIHIPSPNAIDFVTTVILLFSDATETLLSQQYVVALLKLIGEIPGLISPF